MGTIRTEQTRLLQDNGTENIEFYVYDKNGTAKAPLNQSKDVLKQVPSVMLPIEENFMVEYIRPLRDAIKQTELQPTQSINLNPNFRYSTFNWDVTASIASVAIPSQTIFGIQPLTGIYCLQQKILSNVAAKTTHMLKNILLETPVVSGNKITISWNYYFYTLGIGAFNVNQYMSVGLDSTGNGTINKMYDFEENKFRAACGSCGEGGGAIAFTDDRFFRKIDYTIFDSWNLYQTEIECNLTTTETNPFIEVKWFEVTKAQGTEPTVFFDGVAISQNPDSTQRKHTRRSGGKFIQVEGLSLQEEQFVTGEYKQESTFFTNEGDTRSSNYILGVFSRKNLPKGFLQTNTLDKIVLQEIINDFRSPVKRYEGEFYKNDNDETPLYMYHKIWVNYGTAVFQDAVSCIIDKMEYDVKQNKYNIVMHMPNQDDDQISYDLYKLKS